MNIFDYYLEWKNKLLKSGYEKEIRYVENLRFENVTPLQFFQQYVFVVLSSGMKNQVAEKIFCNYKKNGIEAIKHPLKKKAIVESEIWYGHWFMILKDRKTDLERLEYLEKLPHIGKITKYHLARNIGIDCAKPDRHMVKLAKIFYFYDVQQMCEQISKFTGDRVGTVDVVLWRYCNLHPDVFKEIKLSEENKQEQDVICKNSMHY